VCAEALPGGDSVAGKYHGGGLRRGSKKKKKDRTVYSKQDGVFPTHREKRDHGVWKEEKNEGAEWLGGGWCGGKNLILHARGGERMR